MLFTVWLVRYLAEPQPRPPIKASDVRAAGLTAAPQNHPWWFFPHQAHSCCCRCHLDQLTAAAALALPLNLSGPGIRLSSPAIVLPSYFSVILASSLETPSAASVRKRSLFSFSPAE